MDLIFIDASGNFSLNGLLDFILTTLLLCLVVFFVLYFVKRKFPFYTTVGLASVILVSCLFEFRYLESIAAIALAVTSIIYLVANMAETRSLVANRFIAPKKIRNTIVKEKDEVKTFDKEALYKTVNEAVLYLSKHKIGAIMTFERKDKLDNLIKNGSVLNAPVTYELLITIFYPGTRLHDGAVVIRDDEIIAASVYYTPTTKPLIGKYGSRHRAAIGVSEICDAVTVVVSEETGRISIAYNGELEGYGPDNFYKAFGNTMSETESTDNATIEGD
jgi:diadenylate cyclase